MTTLTNEFPRETSGLPATSPTATVELADGGGVQMLETVIGCTLDGAFALLSGRGFCPPIVHRPKKTPPNPRRGEGWKAQKPRASGDFFQAAEGTRTLDLLHGKQTGVAGSRRFLPGNGRFPAVRVLARIRRVSSRFAGVVSTNCQRAGRVRLPDVRATEWPSMTVYVAWKAVALPSPMSFPLPRVRAFLRLRCRGPRTTPSGARWRPKHGSEPVRFRSPDGGHHGRAAGAQDRAERGRAAQGRSASALA